MQALTALQRLTLSETALHPDDLAAHRDARSDSDEEHTRPEQWRSAGLPPSLTCLQLWDNHSLRCARMGEGFVGWYVSSQRARATTRLHAVACACSPDAVAREAVSLPRLRRLVLRGTPVLERRHLQLVLQQSASLRLLQTDWQPGEGAAACDWEADAAFCQEWRLRLQPRCGRGRGPGAASTGCLHRMRCSALRKRRNRFLSQAAQDPD